MQIPRARETAVRFGLGSIFVGLSPMLVWKMPTRGGHGDSDSSRISTSTRLQSDACITRPATDLTSYSSYMSWIFLTVPEYTLQLVNCQTLALQDPPWISPHTHNMCQGAF